MCIRGKRFRGNWLILGRCFLGPWVLADDLNQVLFDHEKQGGAPVNMVVSFAFSQCINASQLVDLGLSGQPFTWCRGELNERLDKVLGNSAWQSVFSNSSVTHLHLPSSYHCGLWVRVSKTRLPACNNHYFKFLSAWLDHEDFGNISSVVLRVLTTSFWSVLRLDWLTCRIAYGRSTTIFFGKKKVTGFSKRSVNGLPWGIGTTSSFIKQLLFAGLETVSRLFWMTMIIGSMAIMLFIFLFNSFIPLSIALLVLWLPGFRLSIIFQPFLMVTWWCSTERFLWRRHEGFSSVCKIWRRLALTVSILYFSCPNGRC